MTTVFPTEYAHAEQAPSLARRGVESRGHVVTDLLLGRQWTATGEIAKACGIKTDRARKLLDRLHARDIVERRVSGNGNRLWRFTPAVAYLLTRQDS